VVVTARDRRGRALALPSLRDTYEQATSADPHRPALFLEGTGSPRRPGVAAEASVKLSIRRDPSALASLLRGLLEVSRRHRHVELRVEAGGAPGSPFARGVGIYRGAFDAHARAVSAWLETFDTRGRALPADTPAPAAGAERIGNLGELHALFAGISFALTYAGAIYLPDGPETARRITPPGRFVPSGWSRDGSKMTAIGATPGGEVSVWVSRAGSGVTAALSLDGAGDPTAASFSPDATSIAVATSGGRLIVIPEEGHSAAASIVVGRGLKLHDPVWSPDGETVAVIAEDASKARALHLVSVAEGKKGARLFGIDAPATEEDLTLADPEFSEDGKSIFVRALWGAKGEPRVARLLRVPATKGTPEPAGPRLSRVRLRGGISRWRNGRFFLAGIDSGDPKRIADSAWLEPAALVPDGTAPVVQAPKAVRLAFGAADNSIVFVRRTPTTTRLFRVKPGDTGKPKNALLPFQAWLSLA
jgi:hypothetical protein